MSYTAEQTQTIVDGYTPNASQEVRDEQVKQLAEQFGVKPASIRGVLSHQKVYVAKATVGKDGKPAVRKETLVNFIRVMVGAPDNTLDTLVNATKADLETLSEALRNLNDQRDAE